MNNGLGFAGMMLALLCFDQVLGREENPTPPAGRSSSIPEIGIAEAVALALERNPDLRSSELKIKEAEGLVRSQRATLLPQVTGEVVRRVIERSAAASGLTDDLIFTGESTTEFERPVALDFRLIPPESIGPYDVAEIQARVSAPLLDRENVHELRAARANAAAQTLRHAAGREGVMAETLRLYLLVRLRGYEVAVRNQKAQLWEQRVRLVEDQRRAGKATELDVLEEKLGLARARNEIRSAENAYAAALREFRRVTGLAADARFILVEDLVPAPFPLADATAAAAAALKVRSDYLAQQQAERAAADQRRAAGASYWPRVDIYGNGGMQGEDFFDGVEAWGAGATLQVPIWDSFARSGRVQQKQSALDQERNRTLDMARAIEDEIHGARDTVVYSREAVDVAREAVEVAAEKLTRTADQEKAGNATPLDVLQARSDLVEAEFRRQAARYDCHAASVQWFKACGNIGRLLEMAIRQNAMESTTRP